MGIARGRSASSRRGKLACLMVGVALFVSVVSFGPPPSAPDRESLVELRPAATASVSVSAAELSARAERLFARGEVGEAIEVAGRAAATAPEQPSAWAVLGRLHAVAGHEAQAHASFASCAAHIRTREVEACNAYHDDFPAR